MRKKQRDKYLSIKTQGKKKLRKGVRERKWVGYREDPEKKGRKRVEVQELPSKKKKKESAPDLTRPTVAGGKPIKKGFRQI